MKTITKTILVLIAIAAVLYAVYVYTHRKVVAPVQQGGEQVAQKFIKENDVISANVTYPVIPGDSKDVLGANVFLKSEIDKKIVAFEEEATQNAAADIGLPKEIKSSVMGSPAIEEKNDRYAAVFMGMEWYMRGAAHPFHTFETYLYDYQEKRFVDSPDMFKQGSDYLNTLSQYSYQDLLAQSKEGDLGFNFDQEMVIDGTRPNKSNFSAMLPLKDGLMIYFSEYQVAPYAAGPQQVSVPYVKLQSLINPNGVLGLYLK